MEIDNIVILPKQKRKKILDDCDEGCNEADSQKTTEDSQEAEDERDVNKIQDLKDKDRVRVDITEN